MTVGELEKKLAPHPKDFEVISVDGDLCILVPPQHDVPDWARITQRIEVGGVRPTPRSEGGRNG